MVCMRTTLNLDDRLVEAAKRRAARERTTLTAVIDAALRQYLAPARRPSRPFRLDLKVRSTKALPGVDLEDRGALYDLMEGR
jgi:hypothetical protein